MNRASQRDQGAVAGTPDIDGDSLVSLASLPSDLVVVGRVQGSYGIRGWLRIEPFNEPGDSVLLHARRWFVQRPTSGPPGAVPGVAFGRPVAGATGSSRVPPPPVAKARPSPLGPAFPLPAQLPVESCRVHGAILVAKIAGIDVKEIADALRGCELGVRRVDFPETEEDEFYWVDLIGCSVVTPQGAPLGVVASVDHHGAHPLLRLRAEDKTERLIPFVSAHVLEVDVPERRIVADWDPEF